MSGLSDCEIVYEDASETTSVKAINWCERNDEGHSISVSPLSNIIFRNVEKYI